MLVQNFVPKKLCFQKSVGSKKNLFKKMMVKKMLVKKNWSKKIWSKKILVKKKIWSKKILDQKFNLSLMVTDCNASALAKNWGWKDFPTMSWDFPKNVQGL